MRYLAVRTVRAVYRDERGKQRIGTFPAGSLTPEGADLRGLDELLALGLLRVTTVEEATRVSRWATVDTETAALNYSLKAPRVTAK